MRGSKNICFILPTLNTGGVETYTLRFLEFLKNRDRVTVVCINQKKGNLHDDYERLGIKIRYLSFGYLNILKLTRFYLFLKKCRFDTVVDFTGNFGGIRIAIAKLAKVDNRIVFYRRSSDAFKPGIWKKQYNRLANRMVYRFASKIFSNSAYAFHFFFPNEFESDSRFKIIANGIDTALFTSKSNKEELRKKMGIPLDSFVVGHVGRYDPAKNHSTMMKVAASMLHDYDDVLFVFCGNGTETVSFRKLANETGYADRIRSLGLQKNVKDVLDLLDAFYFPSITEGQPNALIEAMLADLPIVASNIEPIKETIPFVAHGHLINPLDEIDAIKALLEIKNYPANKERTYKEWAVNKFAQEKNFKLFENEI